MPHIAYNKNSLPAAGHPLQTLSPKAIAAIILMGLMGILWLRVLTGGRTGPAAADAAHLTTQPAAGGAAGSLQVIPQPLPVIEGRHDTLRRDFFTTGSWSAFGPSAAAAATGLSDVQRQQATLEKAVQTLNLDAILDGGDTATAQVCIDGKVLTQGQTFKIKYHQESYEFRISRIDEDQVVLTWNDSNVVLRMTQPERVE